MKKEVELKFRVDDFAPIRRKLKKLGAKLKWSGREKSWFFDTPSQILKKRKAILRIRTTNKTLLTYKEKVSQKGVKVSKEYQLAVEDGRELGTILERLGFRRWLSFTRKREYWDTEGNDVTLDTLPFGKFVEIEAPRKKIRELARRLDLNFAKSTTKTYIQLLEKSSKRNKPG